MANVYQDPAMRVTLSRYVRSQMELCGMTYKSLCERLEMEYGIRHNPDTLRNKVSSGSLGSQMLLFMLMTMGTRTIEIDEIQRAYGRVKEEAAA